MPLSGRARWIAAALALGAAAAHSGIAAKEPPTAAALSDADKAAIARAEARGRLIYAYDQAAWHGTDDLRIKLPDFATKVGGYIVDGPAESPELVFFSRDKDRPAAVYVARFRDNKRVSSKVLGAGDDTGLNPARLKMIEARRLAAEAARRANIGMCSAQPPNTVVLPPETTSSPHLVYIMSPQTKTGSLPFGGHYMFEVAADGKTSAPRPFTKACLELPTVLPTNAPKGASLGVAHFLDPTPTEIHVFSQISMDKPLMVMVERAPRRLFLIKRGKIEAIPIDKLKQS